VGDRRVEYRLLGQKCEGKRQHVRLRNRRRVILKCIVKKRDGEMDWIDQPLGRVV
jgi:hypothetical protein